MRTIELVIDEMRCRGCVRRATAALRDIPGVHTVMANAKTGQVTVRGAVTTEDVTRALAGTSFTVRVTKQA